MAQSVAEVVGPLEYAQDVVLGCSTVLVDLLARRMQQQAQ